MNTHSENYEKYIGRSFKIKKKDIFNVNVEGIVNEFGRCFTLISGFHMQMYICMYTTHTFHHACIQIITHTKWCGKSFYLCIASIG